MRLNGKNSILKIVKRTPFIKETYVAPPLVIISEPKANARAWNTMSILSKGLGKKPVETKAKVPSNVTRISRLLSKLFTFNTRAYLR